jgi:hypothetical protein
MGNLITLILDLVCWFIGARDGQDSKLFPKTDFSDRLTEAEQLRTDMAQRKSCLNRRM